MSALELTKIMGNGTNLGNTLEAYNHKGYLAGQDPSSFEMGWGQPYTTPEMIQGMKDMGFDTIRIPVAWTNGMNFESGDYTIDERLMNRVEEIVNYALDAGMFVIINDHWDGGWWGMFGAQDEALRVQAMEMYKAMWTQIGERFGDYSYRLIFESANEELCDRLNDSDITGSKGTLTVNECYEKTNEINSEFVKLIRSQGGKNADRFLLIAGYNTDITNTCDDRYKMPEDTAKDKLFLSVHYYTPWDYCGTDAINQWGSPDDLEEQNELFGKLTKFTDQGYGVIIGEYAVMKSGSGQKPDTDKFYTNLLNNCDYYNYCPLLWDCSSLYKRASGIVSDETVAAVFKNKQLSTEAGKDYADIQSAAKAEMDALYEAANEEFMASASIPASDDYAVAWIMYQSGDWGVAYSVGDNYDPTNMTLGVKADNVKVEGEGTYTVSLDFTELGGVKGTAFSALAISNGETFFPGYVMTIDEILINGETYEPAGKSYTSSDDGKCTRVNLYNQWISKIPEEARTIDGDISDVSAKILDIGNTRVETLEITFTYTAPQA
ncbi:MAG: glycoside hydrolase family 5 protein [Ruminiclostridium sp.]|nr:glycoside hydrolase family 5 protein [Ruminiclostridium sp.]